MKTTFLLLVLFALAACQSEPVITRNTASSLQLPPPELGEVWDAKHEDQAQRILAITKGMVDEHATDENFSKRDAHPKSHGCAKAQFTVHAGSLPAAQKVGIFAQDKTYDAWIRYSNGAPGANVHDSDKDVRGMAVKIMNAAGHASGSQDFLLMNASVFFSKDGDDYMKLFAALTSRWQTASIALYALRNLESAKILNSARIVMGHPLKRPYHSATIYKLGNKSMRFKAVPCSQQPDDAVNDKLDPNFLHQRLVSHLKAQPGCFNFYVQPNNDARNNPTEDPRKAWDEKVSPSFHVATINLPVQTGIDSKQQKDFCENLSFDPWRSHAATRPLGQINRTRAIVYKEIAQYRHERNRTLQMEPVNHNPCVGATAALCEDPRK